MRLSMLAAALALAQLSDTYATAATPTAAQPDDLAALDREIATARAAGETARSLDLTGRKLALCRRLFGDATQATAAAAFDYGRYLVLSGRQGEAIALLGEITAALTALPRPDPQILVEAYVWQSLFLDANGQGREAEEAARRALTIALPAFGERSLTTLDVINRLADAIKGQPGRREEARALAAKVHALAPASSAASQDSAWAVTESSPAERMASLEQKVRAAEQESGKGSAAARFARANLGVELFRQRRDADAAPMLAPVDLPAERGGLAPTLAVNILGSLAEAAIERGDNTLAADYFARAIAVARGLPGAAQGVVIAMEDRLGHYLIDYGSVAAARDYLADSSRRMLERLAQMRDFDAAAQAQLRDRAEGFGDQVRADWKLAGAR